MSISMHICMDCLYQRYSTFVCIHINMHNMHIFMHTHTQIYTLCTYTHVHVCLYIVITRDIYLQYTSSIVKIICMFNISNLYTILVNIYIHFFSLLVHRIHLDTPGGWALLEDGSHIPKVSLGGIILWLHQLGKSSRKAC